MPNVASALRSEITRLARKEARTQVEPARKSSALVRHEIAQLKRRLLELERRISQLTRNAEAPEHKPDALDGRRFRVQGVRAHRDRLGLSAEQFGRLAGVSGQAIYNWEQGKARPRADALAKLLALRAIGKREAARRLTALDATGVKRSTIKSAG